MDAFAELLQRIQEGDLQTQYNAARVLATSGRKGRRAAPALREYLKNDLLPSLVRLGVTIALLHIEEDYDFLRSLSTFARDADSLVRSIAVEELAYSPIIDAEGTQIAVEALTDADENVRVMAAMALCSIAKDCPELVQVHLDDILKTIGDESERVVLEILYTLQNLGPLARQALPYLVGGLSKRAEVSRDLGEELQATLLAVNPSPSEPHI